MLDHIAIQCADVAAAARFYDAVLAPLGAARVMSPAPDIIGYGVAGLPCFWLGPSTGQGVAREAHLAFHAADRASVTAFARAAVAQGAPVLHAPREWPQYHPGYYAAFVRDPDGNNVEAVTHTG